MNKALAIIIFILVAVMSYQDWKIRKLESAPVSVTVIRDTITVTQPVPVSVTETGQIRVKLPVAVKSVEPEEKVPETVCIDSTATPQNDTDSIEVIVPITTNVYRDSLYRAVVSGYRASLDSITVYRRETYIERFPGTGKTSAKKWSVGVQVGYGTDFRVFGPYVGIGINYNIFVF
jgi:hypothetical protein